MTKKRNFLSPLGLGLFVIVVAIMVAIVSIQRTRQGALAPTAPTSNPQAAEISSNTCSVDFVVPADNNLSCDVRAFRDELTNSAGNYSLNRVIQTIRAGDIVVWNVQVENTGTETANVSVESVLPFQYEQYYSIIDTNCSNFTSTLSTSNCTNILVGAGQLQNFTVRMRVLSEAPLGTVISNQSSISNSSDESVCSTSLTVAETTSSLTCNQSCQSDKECNEGLSCLQTTSGSYACRNPQVPNDVACGVTNVGSADLAITKVASNQSPNINEVISYTITARNNGPDAATGVRVVDVIPEGLEIVTATAGNYIASTRTYTWDVGTLQPNQTATLTMTVRVLTLDAIDNRATISDSSGGTTDPNSSNNTNNPDDSILNANGSADLGVTKTVSNTTPSVGQSVTYTVRVRNYGPNNTTGVEVTDDLPDGVTYQSHTVSKGEFVPGTGVWSVGALTVNEEATLTITVLVNTLTPQVNNVSITGSDLPDGNSSNNTNNPGDSTLNAGGTADLSLTKTVSNQSPKVGDTIAYTVRVTNSGPNTANDVQVTDQIPAGVSFVNYTATQGDYNQSTGIWNIGTLTVNQQVTLTLNVRVESATTIENRASITRSSLPDPNSSNNANDPSSARVNSGSATLTNTPVPTATTTLPQLPRAGFANSRTILILGIILTVVILGAVGIILLL